MNKGKYIQKIIGPILEPEGYQFKNFSGQSSWVYYKDLCNNAGDNVQLQVRIKRHRFAPVVEMLLYSNAYKQGRRSLGKFVPDWTKEGLVCQTDEEFKEAINLFAHIIEKHGLKELEIIKEPVTAERFSKEQEKFFYDNLDTIRKKYVMENNLKLETDQDKNITFIFDKLRDIREDDYFEIQDELMGLASLHAFLYEKKFETAREWNEKANVCLLILLNVSNKQLMPLHIIDWCWREHNDKRCLDMLKSRL